MTAYRYLLNDHLQSVDRNIFAMVFFSKRNETIY